MSQQAQRQLLELAQSISDGSGVDWLEVSAASGNKTGDLVLELELLGRMAEFHRQLDLDEPSTPSSQRTWGHLEIIEELGRGGFGEVYRAWDPVLQREVALKLLVPLRAIDPRQKESVIRESRLLAKIRHSHVVTVHGLEEHDGRIGFWMDFILGHTLSELVKSQGPLGAREAAGIGAELCSALAAVHGTGVVHRDIKAQNVMRETGGRIVLMDFGLGIDRADGQADKIGTHLAGTPYYMTPELLEGGTPTPQSDLYALGILLYHLVTGTFPVKGETVNDLKEAWKSGDVRFLRDDRPELPSNFIEVVERALNRDPERRYKSAGEMERALTTSVSRVSPSGSQEGDGSLDKDSSPAETQQDRSPRWGSRGGKIAVAVVVAATIALALSYGPLDEWWKTQLFSSHEGGAPLSESAKKRLLIVLPFAVVGKDDRTEAICQGLWHTLNSKVSQLGLYQESIQVVSPSDVKDKDLTAESAQRRFNVDLAIRGSCQQTKENLRISLSLVNARTLGQRGSTTIDSKLEREMSVQDEAVVRIAQMLRLTLPQPVLVDLRAGSTEQSSAARHYLQAQGYLRRMDLAGHVEAAVELLEEAVRQDSEYALAHAALAEAYLHKSRDGGSGELVARAENSCRRALALENGLPEIHVSCGKIYNATGRSREAIQSFVRALELDDRNAPAYEGLARTYEELERFEKAESTYESAIELRPTYWGTFARLGAFYFRQKRWEEAEEQFKRVMELTPGNYQAFNNLGAAFARSGMREKARTYYERSNRVEPNYAATSNLGQIHMNEGEDAKAVERFRQALTFKSQYSVLENLGRVQSRLGQKSQAREAFEQAAETAQRDLEVRPNNEQIVADLGYFRAMLGEREEALPLLGRALELGGDRKPVLIKIAAAYEGLGMIDEAIQRVEKALELGYPANFVLEDERLKNVAADPRMRARLR